MNKFLVASLLAVSFTASGTATNVVRATGPVAGAQVVPTSRA